MKKGLFHSDDDEIRRLESSIVEESSPIRIVKRRRVQPHGNSTRYIRLSPSVSSQHEAEGINRPCGGGEQLSNSQNQVYEILSTQTSSEASPVVSRTPVSEWIYQEVERNEEIIVHLDSPKRDRQNPSSTKKSRPPVRPPCSILESFTAITTRYNSSVRLFAHDLRSGKYDQDTPLLLLIRKVVECQDKLLLQTVAYDMNERRDRWVLFKPTDMSEISEGVFVKVYRPWHEVSITGTSETMILGTDFYKILQKSKLTFTKDQTQKIRDLPLPTSLDTRVADPLFINLVPYHIRNINHTIEYHVARFDSMLDINVVILHKWVNISPALCLLKDSNDFMTFLQVPNTSDVEDQPQLVLTKLLLGKCFRLQNIALAGKICISKNLAPFSVMQLFGGKQTFYYSLKWQGGISQCIPEENLSIPMDEMRNDLKNIDYVYMAPYNQDHRISLKCKIKEKELHYILVTDDESDRSLRIEFVFDANYDDIKEYSDSCPSNCTLLLNFLRVIQGKRIWDCYTTYEEVDADDEEQVHLVD